VLRLGPLATQLVANDGEIPGASVLEGAEGARAVTLRPPRLEFVAEEGWGSYRARVSEYLSPIQELAMSRGLFRVEPLHAASALAGWILPKGLVAWARDLAEGPDLALELTVPRKLGLMNEVHEQLELPRFEGCLSGHDGRGARVALIDTGAVLDGLVDGVFVASTVVGELHNNRGRHGSCMASCIASRSSTRPGIAPGADLLVIQALRADETGTETSVCKAVDVALDEGAHVLSLSLGFNHIPAANGGDGWICPDGDCEPCRAVDAAVSSGSIVVAAAGNEYRDVAELSKQGVSLDTALNCPSQASLALCVGATDGAPWRLWASSCRGKPSYSSEERPHVVAPGTYVDVSWQQGLPAECGGTSAATAIVAGVVALLIQKQGPGWTVASVRTELMGCCQRSAVPQPGEGWGQPLLSRLCPP